MAEDPAPNDEGKESESRVRHDLKPPRSDVRRHHGLHRAHNRRPTAKSPDNEALVADDTDLRMTGVPKVTQCETRQTHLRTWILLWEETETWPQDFKICVRKEGSPKSKCGTSL